MRTACRGREVGSASTSGQMGIRESTAGSVCRAPGHVGENGKVRSFSRCVTPDRLPLRSSSGRGAGGGAPCQFCTMYGYYLLKNNFLRTDRERGVRKVRGKLVVGSVTW